MRHIEKMRVNELLNGPSVHSIGALVPPAAEPWLWNYQSGQHTGAAIDRSWIESFPHPVSSSFGEEGRDLRRRGGFSRSRSAALCSTLAATLSRGLLRSLDVSPEKIGIAIATTSAPTQACFDFEMRGIQEGWRLVDPLSFPSTIESAASTQIASATGCRGFAVTFTTPVLGYLCALEYAAITLSTKRSLAAIVAGVEEIGGAHLVAYQALGCRMQALEGASGVVLSSGGVGWRIALLAEGSSSFVPLKLPDNWRNATIIMTKARDEFPYYYSLVHPMRLLLELPTLQRDRILLVGETNSGEWIGIGFSHDR